MDNLRPALTGNGFESQVRTLTKVPIKIYQKPLDTKLEMYYNVDKIKKGKRKMIAVLGWTDGFGNDTYVKAIYPTLEEAKYYASENDRWEEFDYGLVDFDWYEANEFREIKHKKRKKK